jgi:hypothetical protein
MGVGVREARGALSLKRGAIVELAHFLILS